jgi:hypothetical protein
MSTELKKFNMGEESVEFPLHITQNLYKELKDIIGKSEISRSNIVIILISLMQIIERYDKISGIQKKAIIISTLYDFIDDNIEDNEDKVQLKLLVQMTIPSVIDSIISFDKSEVAINIHKKCSSVIFKCLK